MQWKVYLTILKNKIVFKKIIIETGMLVHSSKNNYTRLEKHLPFQLSIGWLNEIYFKYFQFLHSNTIVFYSFLLQKVHFDHK